MSSSTRTSRVLSRVSSLEPVPVNRLKLVYDLALWTISACNILLYGRLTDAEHGTRSRTAGCQRGGADWGPTVFFAKAEFDLGYYNQLKSLPQGEQG